MASKQSITRMRLLFIVVSFVLAIGHIELYIFRFVVRWIVSILCIVFGASIAYLTFYFFIVLPHPTILLQYQHIPSIAIFDSKGTLLYKEWNTQRQIISLQDVIYYRDALPAKESMTSYLALHTTRLKTKKDMYWFQKKMMYLYPYTSIAALYMNAKIFQNGVVGIRDATEVYFQKDWKTVGKATIKALLSPNGNIPHKDIYARMPIETYAIRDYIEQKITSKKTGWLRIETSLDVQIGTTIAYKSLIEPNNDTVIIEGNMVRAWTKENDQLLAARAIIKTKEGGEYNE